MQTESLKSSASLKKSSNKEPEWIEKQRKGFTLWVNSHLTHYEKTIDNLSTGFHNGLNLYYLVVHLAKVQFTPIKKEPKHKLEVIGILNKSLEILKSQAVKIVNISSEDIYDNNEKLIFGLIWTLILHYQLGQLHDKIDASLKPKNDAELVLFSVKDVLKLSENDSIDLVKSIPEGKVLYALVHSIGRPVPIRMETLLPLSAKEYIYKSVDDAEKYLKVPRMIDPEDFISSKYDNKIFATYLSSIILAQPEPSTLPPLDTIIDKEKLPVNNIIEKQSINLEESIPTTVVDEKSPVSAIQVNESPALTSQLEEDLLEPIHVKEETPTVTQEEPVKIDPKAAFYQKMVDCITDLAYTTPVIDLSEYDYVEKLNSGLFMVDLNQVSFVSTTSVEIYLINKHVDDLMNKVHRTQISLGRKNIADVEFKDIPLGDYDGILIIDTAFHSRLSKRVRVKESHELKIHTSLMTSKCISGFPVELMFDRSDFNGEEISVEISGPFEDSISTNYSANLTYFTCIPSKTGPYLIHYYKNQEKIINSSFQLYVEDCTNHEWSRPMPIGHAPYAYGFYQQNIEFLALVVENNKVIKKQISILSADKVQSVILFKDRSCESCQTDFVSEKYYSYSFKPLISGLAIIDSFVLRKDGSIMQLLCQPIIVESNILHPAISTQLRFLKKDSSMKIKEVKYQENGSIVNFETNSSSINNKDIEEISFTPTFIGDINISADNASNNSQTDFVFSVQNYSRDAVEAFVNQKFSKSFHLTPESNDNRNISVQLFDGLRIKTHVKTKIFEDVIKISFIPNKSGIYTLYIKIDGVDIQESPLKIYCLNAKPRILNTTYIENFETVNTDPTKSILKQTNCSTGKTKNFSLVYYSALDDKDYYESVINYEEVGNYIHELFQDNKSIKLFPCLFHVKDTSDSTFTIGENAKLTVSFNDFVTNKVPQAFSGNSIVLDRKLPNQQIEFNCVKSAEEHSMDLQFIPSQIGIVRISPQYEGKPLFKDPFMISVHDKPYQSIFVDDNMNSLYNTGDKTVLYLEDISKFKYYQDSHVENLKLYLADDGNSTSSFDICVDQNGKYCVLLPKKITPGEYRMNLSCNGEILERSTLIYYKFPVASDGQLSLTNIENYSSTEVSCKIISKGKEIERISFTPGKNSIPLKTRLTSFDLFEVIPEGTYSKSNFPFVFNVFQPQEIPEKSKIFVIVDNNNHSKLPFSTLKLTDNTTGNANLVSLSDISENTFELDIEPTHPTNRQLSLFFPDSTEQIFEINGSSDCCSNRPPQTISVDETSILLLDLPSTLKEKSNEEIMDEIIVYDLYTKLPLEPSGEIEIFGDKIKFPYNNPIPGKYLLFVADKNSVDYMLGVATLVSVGESDPDAKQVNILSSKKSLQKSVVNEKSSITMKFKDPVELDELELKFSPSLVDYKKKLMDEKTVKISYIPKVMGVMTIDMFYKGQSLLPTPLRIKSLNHSLDYFEEDLKYTAKKTIKFSLNKDLKDFLSEITNVLLDPNGNKVPNKIKLLNVGHIDITFVIVSFLAKVHGQYTLSILKSNNSQEISKFQFYVSPWYPIYDDIQVFGRCLKHPIVKSSNRFVIYNSRDKNLDFRVSVTGVGECDLKLLKKSYYQTNVSWTPHVEGHYKLQITYILDGQSKEFVKDLYAKKKDTISSELMDKNKFMLSCNTFTKAIVGVANSFHISSEDPSVENTKATITGPQPVTITEHITKIQQLTTKSFTYIVPTPGKYIIETHLPGQDIDKRTYIVKAINLPSQISSIDCSLTADFTVHSKRISEFLIDTYQDNNPDLSIRIYSSDQTIHVPVTVTNLDKYIYSVQFTCPTKQTYIAEIDNHGIAIRDSPFTFKAL